jgi:hypothetical protein
MACELIDPIRPPFGDRRSVSWVVSRNWLKFKDSERERAIILPLTIRVPWCTMRCRRDWHRHINERDYKRISFVSPRIWNASEISTGRILAAMGVSTFKAAACVRYIRRVLCRYINMNMEAGQRFRSSFARDARSRRMLWKIPYVSRESYH